MCTKVSERDQTVVVGRIDGINTRQVAKGSRKIERILQLKTIFHKRSTILL